MIKISIKPEYSGCLEEAMADLKAMKTKYKDDPILSKIVDALEGRDPSGNHKYINWAMKQMEIAYKEGGFDDPSLDRDSVARVMARKVLRMGDMILDFHNLSKKGAAWRDNAGKPLSKDLNSWTDIETLEHNIDTAKSAVLRGKKEKEAGKRASLQAKSESDVVYDDEEFMVIRPLSPHASCYYGQGTKWCISATDSQNYFDSYTKEGKAFYFVMDKTRSNDDPLKKVAWVGSTHGTFDEFYDATDDEIGYDGARSQMEETSPEKATEIEADIDDHLNNNLPDNGWEEQVTEITAEANRRMDMTEIDAQIEDELQSIYADVTTRFMVHGNFDDDVIFKRIDEIGDMVYEAIKGDIYLSFDTYDAGENVHWDWRSDGHGTQSMYLKVGIRPDRGIDSPEEYESFANDVEVEIDDKNAELTELIRREFIDRDILPPSFIDKVSDQLEEEKGVWEWDNVAVTYVGEELEYDFVVPGVKILSDAAHQSFWKQAKKTYSTNTIEIINEIAADIQRTNKKQLDLPGMGRDEEDIAQLQIDKVEEDFHMGNVYDPGQIPSLGTSAKSGPAGSGPGIKLTVKNTNYNHNDREAKMNYQVMKLMNEYPERFRKGIRGEIEILNQSAEPEKKVTESKKKKINIIIESKKK